MNTQEKVDVLIFRHSKDTPPGSTIEWLTKRNKSYSIFFWGHDDLSTMPKEFSWLIILGGPQNVDQEDQFPWLKEEKTLIKQALFAGKKVLGLCLGGQLMAEVLGGKVEKHKHWEVGWSKVFFKPEVSPLIPRVHELESFQYHGYHFITPPNATTFAFNEITKNQGFVFESKAVAVQFHPESTCDWIKECADEDQSQLVGPYVQNKDEILKSLKLQDQLQNWYFQLLENLDSI